MKTKFVLFSLLAIVLIGCTLKNESQKKSLKNINATSDNKNLIKVGSMVKKRAAHSSTLLKDGRILIAGGIAEDGNGNELPMNSAEIFNPETNEFTAISNMIEPHCNHTATLLENGEVLIIAGWKPGVRSDALEIYNPETGEFRLATRLDKPLQAQNTVLLKNGKILIVGGNSSRSDYQMEAFLYDYKTNSFEKTGSLNYGRMAFTATLLNNGNVLITGGDDGNQILNKAEIYNTATGKFELTGDLNFNRYKHGAVLMQNGNVLLAGGSDKNDWNGKYKSSEIYDVNTGKFSVVEMKNERFKLQEGIVSLTNGNVLVGGGSKTVEMYNSSENKFIAMGELDDANYYTCLTLLNNGKVLITGGYNNKIVTTSSAYIFQM